jgi:hypothetical protein
MTDQTNWDTQPKAGWREFEAARARFYLQRQRRTLPTPDLHAEHHQGAGGWEQSGNARRMVQDDSSDDESREVPAKEQ